MGWLRTFVVFGAALAISGAGAYAADMPGYPPLPRPEYKPVFFNVDTGWYLRGDIGAHWGLITAAQPVAPFAKPTNNSLGTGMTASLGVGIKSDWLRTDVTIDYAAPVKYKGTVAAPDDTTAKIQATTALVNGYLDLGNWYRMTPYIGAGAGVAYARVSDYVGPDPPFSDSSKHAWNFAYAGMAGVAFALSRNVMVDAGYRYLNIGDVLTANNGAGAMRFKNIAAHEVRVGVRWSFDDLRYAR